MIKIKLYNCLFIFVARPAYAMIMDAEKKNLISPGKVSWIFDLLIYLICFFIIYFSLKLILQLQVNLSNFCINFMLDNSDRAHIRKYGDQYGIYGCHERIQNGSNHALLHKLREEGMYESIWSRFNCH